MTIRRRLAPVLLAVALAGACGSGSGTENNDGVPAGPEDAGTSGSTITPTPHGGE